MACAQGLIRRSGQGWLLNLLIVLEVDVVHVTVRLSLLDLLLDAKCHVPSVGGGAAFDVEYFASTIIARCDWQYNGHWTDLPPVALTARVMTKVSH